MRRDIYEVYAKVVDSNGSYNTLSGYPKAFDSKNYGNDLEKTRNRAYGEYHATLGAMYPRDDRQLQIAMLIYANSGQQIEMGIIGKIEDLPDTAEE